jgi:hypothetical protein
MPPCACRSSNEQKPQYGLMMLVYQHFTAVLLLLLCCHENVGMNIKFLVKLGKSGSKIREMLVQVYGDNAMKKIAVYKWMTRFSEGRESVTDKDR